MGEAAHIVPRIQVMNLTRPGDERTAVPSAVAEHHRQEGCRLELEQKQRDEEQKRRDDERKRRDKERKRREQEARKRRKEECARASGYEDAAHKEHIIAAVETVCGRLEKMKKAGLPQVTLTVENDDGGKAEVTVSEEACVADVLAVVCAKLSKSLPRSTLSLGGHPLDGFMAAKLSDMDIETDAVLRLVQLCDGQVNEEALKILTERGRASHCMCLRVPVSLSFGPPTSCMCVVM